MFATLQPALRFVLAMALVMVVSACGGRQGFASAWSPKELRTGAYSTPDETALRSALAERSRRFPELVVDAGVKVRYPGGGGFISVRSLYQDPDRIRLRGSRLDITLFDLLLNGDSASLYIREEGARYDGTVVELARASGAIGGLSPRELISSLQVLPQLREVLDDGRPVVVTDRGNSLLVAARVASGQGQGFWLVRKDDGLVREFLLRGSDGEERIRVRYDSYQLQGDDLLPMPDRFTLSVAEEGSTFAVDVSNYNLAPTLRPEQFAPQDARRVRPLALLGGGEPPQ